MSLFQKGIIENNLKKFPLEEENISKRFYQEYSTFRKELFQNLMLCNPEVEKLLLFKKTQKLLDRFLFLFFAKDKGLIAANSVLLVLNNWKVSKNDPFSAKRSLYDYFKSYFDYLNVGFKNEKLEIFAYNGGLFAPDEIIDNFKITDNVLEKACEILSKYNYDSEVDVNILGHIFEHSLKEIEELEAQFFDVKIKQNQKITKRKKDGIFYTPRYITKYIVENTLGVLCSQEKQRRDLKEEDYFFRKNIKANKATIQTLLDNLHNYKDWLLNLSIVDPACGSGAFLNQALTFLINEHKWLNELEAKLMGSSLVFDLENSILENNLFGVDINEESVEISKLSLWLRTAKPHRKLTSLNDNIKCGNSLVDDPNVAGEKAFNWQQAFPHIFEKGGFDVIIGNPPYGALFSNKEIDFLNKNYTTFEYQANSYPLFYERGFSLLKEHGFLGYITPATFTYQFYFKNLRKLLQNYQTEKIIKYEYEVFEDANIGDSVIWISKNTKNAKSYFIFSINQHPDSFYIYCKLDYNKIVSFDGTYKLGQTLGINYEKLLNYNEKLGDYVEISVGIKAYQIGKGVPKQTAETVKLKPFTSNKKVDETYINCVNGKDFYRYIYLFEPEMWLSYGTWLAEPRESVPFCSEQKIILRQTSDSLIAHYDADYKLNLNNVYNVWNTNPNINLKYVLALLNSKLLNKVYQYLAQEKGRLFAEVKKFNLAKLPFIFISLKQQQPFVEKVNQILSLNEKLFQLKIDFMDYLECVLQIRSLSSKLQMPEKLTFDMLVNEFRKQKIEISDFNIFKSIKELHSKFIEIKNKIEITDQQINQMVYELYELTPEEIAILESE